MHNLFSKLHFNIYFIEFICLLTAIPFSPIFHSLLMILRPAQKSIHLYHAHRSGVYRTWQRDYVFRHIYKELAKLNINCGGIYLIMELHVPELTIYDSFLWDLEFNHQELEGTEVPKISKLIAFLFDQFWRKLSEIKNQKWSLQVNCSYFSGFYRARTEHLVVFSHGKLATRNRRRWTLQEHWPSPMTEFWRRWTV